MCICVCRILRPIQHHQHNNTNHKTTQDNENVNLNNEQNNMNYQDTMNENTQNNTYTNRRIGVSANNDNNCIIQIKKSVCRRVGTNCINRATVYGSSIFADTPIS